MVFRKIKRLLVETRVVRFILKHSDMVTSVSRDRSFEEMAGEAVTAYMDENYRLLPRRYKLILEQLRDAGLISEQDFIRYEESAHNTLLGGGTIAITTDEDGTKHWREIPVQNFPWVDHPDLLARLSTTLRKKIDILLADATKAHKDERAFADTLGALAASSHHKNQPDDSSD